MLSPDVRAFRLLGVTDRRQLGDGWALDDWLAVLCWHGLRAVQLRERDLDEDALFALAMTCRPIFERHHLAWFVNGSVEVARRAEATGVHLRAGQDPAAARAVLGPDATIGQSVHGLAEARAAQEGGVDYVVFGPVFETPSKAGFGPPLGLEALQEVCAALTVPVYAIGGITPVRAEVCVKAGARGVAAVSALMRAEAPEETLAMFADSLGGL